MENKINYLSFEDARNFVRNLGLRSYKEWIDYIHSGNKPEEIPSIPNIVYLENGFISLEDFIDADTYLPYEEAQYYVTKLLNIKSQKEWLEYCGSGNKPNNIPFTPDQIYKDSGWKSWNDFLNKRLKVNLFDISNFLKNLKTELPYINEIDLFNILNNNENLKYLIQNGLLDLDSKIKIIDIFINELDKYPS